MKRKFTFVTAAIALLAFLAIPMGMRGQTRTEITWDASQQGYQNSQSLDTIEIELDDYITIQFDKSDGNNAPAYYNTGSAVRMYPKNSLTVTPISGYQITGMTLTFSGASNVGSLSASVGNYSLSSNTGTWTGSSSEAVVLTNIATSGHARLQVLAVTYTDGSTPTPTTYTVTYNANVTGVAHIVDTYNEGTNVTLRPANTFTYDGHTFSEWNTQADGDGDPYDAGGVIENIQANIELYAIWAENPVSDEQWVLSNLADLTENDVFVIVGNNGSNYAMSNNNGTTNPPDAVAVTVANDEITSLVAANIQWTISGNATDGYIFYPNGSTETWLYCYNNNNGLRVGTGNDKTFVMNSNYLYNSGQGRYIGIYQSSNWRSYTSINNNIQGQTFAFYKKVTGGVVPPSITAANVDIEYNATSGSITYTINNVVEGGTISASVTEGGDWLTLGQGTTSPIQFTCNENAAGTERTATVTLTYTYNRATATANVTVTQAGNPNATMTIAEARAQQTGDVATIGIVTSFSVNNSSNKTTAYIQDATAAIVVFGEFTVAIGDEIRVSGTLSNYNGLLEIGSNNSNSTVTVISSGNIVNPTVMTIAEINTSTNQGWYIRIEGATVTNISGSGNSQNTTIAQGDNTVVVRGNLGTTVAVNDIISLNGNIGCYNGVQIANPQNVTVQQNTEPSITLDTYEIEVPAEGGEGTINVTYQNWVVTTGNTTVYFYTEDGNNYATYDWITAEIDANYNVHYVVEANQGAARTAYFRVDTGEEAFKDPGTGGGFLTYYPISDLVTVSQAAYVAPTFAALPFEFDEGRAAIDTIDGLYQEGLGSDYTNSPKLKFNDEGDYLLLQFNEEPGKLTFNIKGNPSSGVWEGTFKVQTSEDGVTYTDLEVYDNLTTTVQPGSFDLDENVRYVKWVYTEKVSGNVALGKIKLLKPATMYSLTVEPFENLEIFTFVGGDESEMALEGAGTIQVAEGDQVMLSVTANDGYEISSLIVDGVEHVNDITEEETYTFTMPGHNVTISATAVEVTPSTTDEYVLYTGELVEGDYIIYYNGKAMNNVVSNDRLQYAEIEPEDDVITTDNATIVWHIAPNDEGYWTIFSADANAYAASTGVKNKAQMLEDGTDDKAMWSDSLTEDGTYEFVNKANAAANVNAYLRNNGTYGFACYATTTGGALSLYKKVEQTTVTQTIALSIGANWVSFNVEITLDDLKAALVEASPNATITIKSQENNTYYSPNNHRWAGNVAWDLAKMYVIKVTEACEITVQGYPVDPAEHPVTIKNGKNWIAFPLRQSMEIADVFAEASPGDKIKSRIGITTRNSNGWRGNITNLVPGQGYIYDSNKTEDWIFTFPISTKATQNSVKHEVSRTTIMMSTATKR